MITTIPLLAFKLFFEPLPLDGYWPLLILPLVAVIAVVYKVIKLEDLSGLPSEAAWLSVQILGFMGLAAAVLWGVTVLA